MRFSRSPTVSLLVPQSSSFTSAPSRIVQLNKLLTYLAAAYDSVSAGRRRMTLARGSLCRRTHRLTEEDAVLAAVLIFVA